MKKIYILTVLIALLVIPAACNLDRFPTDVIDTQQAFRTADDAEKFNTGMYADLRNRVYGQYMYAPDVQSDLLNATVEYGNTVGGVHSWTFSSSDYYLTDIWAYPYSAIADINNFLDNVSNVVLDTDPDQAAEEQARIDLYVGEAHLMRAYYYHNLVRRYAKPYNDPTQASTDLGVPVVITYDINARPARATIAQVYDQILADIAVAKTLLITDGAVGSEYLTADCVTALEARVYLYMHRYADAAASANTLITSVSPAYPLISDPAAFSKIWTDDDPAESIFQLFASKPSELPNNVTYLAANDIYINYVPGVASNRPLYVPQQWVVDLFDPADTRYGVFVRPMPVNIRGINYPSAPDEVPARAGISLISKYPGNPALNTEIAPNSNYQHKPKVFRIAEMYLIRAEALAMQPTPDYPNALATLNLLRVARGLTALTGVTGTALVDAIREERTRELLCEGQRLDDLKRWGLGVVRLAPQNDAIAQAGTGMVDLNRPANDNKLQAWGIPANDKLANRNIIQNPGW